MKNKQAELINNLSDDVLVLNVYLTQGIVFSVSTILAFFLFDSWSEFFSIFQFYDQNIVLGLLAGIAVVAIDLLLMKFVSPTLFDDGGINERIFRNLSYVQIVFLTFVVALCEEFLFRGVIQTHTNIWIASGIFALVHYRYLFKPFLLVNVTLLSLCIGFLYEITDNLVVTIMAHFIIDFLLGVHIKRSYDKEKKKNCESEDCL